MFSADTQSTPLAINQRHRFGPDGLWRRLETFSLTLAFLIWLAFVFIDVDSNPYVQATRSDVIANHGEVQVTEEGIEQGQTLLVNRYRAAGSIIWCYFASATLCVVALIASILRTVHPTESPKTTEL